MFWILEVLWPSNDQKKGVEHIATYCYLSLYWTNVISRLCGVTWLSNSPVTVCRLGPAQCCVLRLSGPLKQQYAQVGSTPADPTVTMPLLILVLLLLQEHGLDLNELLSPGPYKEQYRASMINWGEIRRRSDPGFFCRLATREAWQPVWVWCHSCCWWKRSLGANLFPLTLFCTGQMVSDARRLSDLQWFWSKYPQQTRSVRVQCSDKTRQQRGWSFTAGQIPFLYRNSNIG